MATRIFARSLRCGFPTMAQKVTSRFLTFSPNSTPASLYRSLNSCSSLRKKHIDALQQLKFESMLASTEDDTTKLIELLEIRTLATLILQLSDLAVEHLITEKAEQRFLPYKVVYLVDVPGYEKDDLKVEIQERTLFITGARKDLLGQDVSINKEVKVPDDCVFDPEEGHFETRHGQLQATFPVYGDKTLEKKTGRYVVKCI